MREIPRSVVRITALAALSGSATGVEPVSFQQGSLGALPAIASHATAAGELSNSVLLTLPEPGTVAFVQCFADGSQTVGSPIEAGGQLRFATIADVDGDGLDDVISSSPATGRVNIIRQTSPGVFTLGAVLPVGQSPAVPVAIDLTSDGLPELVVPLRGEARIAILPNIGNGLFGAGIRLDTSALPDAAGFSDFNSDGIIDLAVTCAGSATIDVHLGAQGPDGTSFATAPATSLPTGSSPGGLIVGDFDGDGHSDLATANAGSASVSVFYSDGVGGFADSGFLFAGTAAQAIRAADVDQNGLLDLVVANPSVQAITVLQAEAGRGFARNTVQVPVRPSRIAVVDASDDGRPDLLVTSQTAAQSLVLLNTTETTPCPGDVSGDLRVDLQDLNLVLSNFGTGSDRGDANGDGEVTLADLNLVLANFGVACAES